MGIRGKLLILLLAIALVPLVAAAVLHRISTRRLGGRLAADTREALTEDARNQLQTLVDGFAEVLARDRRALEHAVRFQAREVERRLAGPVPSARKRFFSADFDLGRDLPEGMISSPKHFRSDADGKPAPIAVTYAEQVVFVVRGVNREAVADDLRRLATMPEAYAFVYRWLPRLMYWQYTSLECGFHTSYPGHGGYPEEYDPRRRRWYQDAKEKGDLTWIVMPEVSTRTIALTVATPVRRPDGSFAGVTAVDVPLLALFEALKLPPQWAGEARAMLVAPEGARPGSAPRLAILAQKSYQGFTREWQKPLKLEYLESEDREALAQLLEDVAAGRSGVRRMRYRGREALWAYGPGEAITLVVVPYDLIVAKATAAEQYVLSKTVEQLTVTGLMALVAVLGVAVVALRSSRAVTRPVSRLASAARRLAEGDFAAAVDIGTGDELQALGDVFNSMGPKLRERERMRQSLALAMEIQQRLLPQEAPRLPGFEVVGGSTYCDETGGDYYDFIDLVHLDESKMGIAVGDVTGHGIGAALLMASARAALRSNATRHGADPTALFDAVNTHLVRDSSDERFMTLFYGILDTRSRELRWTSAGHDPPLLLRGGSGQVEELEATGVPLGLFEEATFEPGPILLGPGDLLAIGTDGIWEARNPAGELFGRERFRQVLLDARTASARGVYEAVLEGVSRFAGAAPQRDDITLVVLKTV